MSLPSPVVTGQLVTELRLAAAAARQPEVSYYRQLIAYAEQCDQLAQQMHLATDDAAGAALGAKYELYAELYRTSRDHWFGTPEQQQLRNDGTRRA